MTYDKLRTAEELLINIHSEGFNDEKKREIELYFEKNYGKDSLSVSRKPDVKTKAVTKKEKPKLNNNKAFELPDEMQHIIARNIKKAFGGAK